jgi:hypothetical protein
LLNVMTATCTAGARKSTGSTLIAMSPAGEPELRFYSDCEKTDFRRPFLGAVKQVLLGSLGEPALALCRAYRHASTNRRGYERFCFARWFYIAEFMKRAGVTRACVLDSDILLFSPIDRFVAEFEGYDAGNWSWANVVTMPGVDRICSHLMGIMSNEKRRHDILTKYGVVSDMTCMAELAGPTVLDQSPLVNKGFDPNFNSVCQRFHFLHFQGDAKRLMSTFASPQPFSREPCDRSSALRYSLYQQARRMRFGSPFM